LISKIRFFTYGIAIVIIVILVDFVYKYFSGVINNGLVYNLEKTNSMLGELFQTIKLLFVILNFVGIVLGLIILIRNYKKFNKYVLGLVLFNLFYSVIIFLWVLNSTNSPQIPAEQLMGGMTDLFSGESQDTVNPLISFAMGFALNSLLTDIYVINLYNATIMVILSLLLIFLKYKLDKKISIPQANEQAKCSRVWPFGPLSARITGKPSQADNPATRRSSDPVNH
jgi:hypothetical protein